MSFFQNDIILLVAIFGVIFFPIISIIITVSRPYFNDIKLKDLEEPVKGKKNESFK